MTPFAKLHVLALRHACSGPLFDECGGEKPDLYRFVARSTRRGTMLPEVLPIKFLWVGLSCVSKAKVRHLCFPGTGKNWSSAEEHVTQTRSPDLKLDVVPVSPILYLTR